MAIERIVSKVIHDEIDRLPSDELGGINPVMIGEYINSLALHGSTGHFLEQPPDTHPEEIIDFDNLLGSYSPMRSPGRLVLYQENIRQFFWCLVRDVFKNNPNIWVSSADLKNMADIIVRQTWWHEQFHFCCDVFRHLFASRFDSMTEEALAVAFSRIKIREARQDGRTSTAKIHPTFFTLLLERAFEYSSPGYRDWPKYSDPETFSNKLADYSMMNQYMRLAYNGVDLPSLSRGMIDTLLMREEAGYFEKIL